MRQAAVSMDEKSWQAGYAAGLEGKPNTPPPHLDGLAFSSGYVEGKAHRDGYDVEGRRRIEQERKPC